MTRLRFLPFAVVAAFALAPVAFADVGPAPQVEARVDVPPALLAGLARHAEAFEQMKARGAYTLDGTFEEVASDGHVASTKEARVRIEARRGDPTPKVDIVRYLEDGHDKTQEAREKAASRKPKKDKKELKIPFLASEQPRYVFAVVEHDRNVPTRVRVAFDPKEPAEDAIKGTAWVDTTKGEILSMGFSFSKNPTFIDHVDVTLTFGNTTPLGRAPSAFSFDGRGSFLFIHKHFRGRATITDARVAY